MVKPRGVLLIDRDLPAIDVSQQGEEEGGHQRNDGCLNVVPRRVGREMQVWV